MRNAVIGLIIGIVAGIVLGTTVIAPRLAPGTSGIDLALVPSPASKAPEEAAEKTTDKDAAEKTASGTEMPLPEAAPAVEKKTDDTIRFRMASAFGENLALHGTAAKQLEKTIWRISGGSFDLRFNPPGALVAEDEALDAVVSGAVDAYFTGTDALAARNPALSLFAGSPFGGDVAAYLGWMSDGGGKDLFDELLAGMGLKGLVCGLVPRAGGGWFKKPLVAVDDLKGLKIRAQGIEAALYRRLGAEVVDLSLADTLVALESGLLNGAVLSSPHVDWALGAARAGMYYYMPGWRAPASVFTLLFPLKKWEDLAAVHKTQVETACGENIRNAIATGEALQFKALKQITAKGAKVEPWPAEIRDAVRDAWRLESAEQAKNDGNYARVLKSFETFRKGQSIWEELARP